MGEYDQQELDAWALTTGGSRGPQGSPEPEKGRCGTHLHNKRIRTMEAFLEIPKGSSTPRYCLKYAGQRTNHEGFGPCWLHLGNTVNIDKKYLPMAMEKDLHTFAELWQMPVGLDPAPVEAARLVLKIKKTMLVMEKIVEEMGDLDVYDQNGRNQIKGIFEAWERSQDRFVDIIKFALKFDLAERQVELEEAQARGIATAVLSVVMDAELQLETWQTAKIRENLAKMFQKLAPNLRPEWAQDFETESYIDAEEVD